MGGAPHHFAKNWYRVMDTDGEHLNCEHEKHNSNWELTDMSKPESHCPFRIETSTSIEHTIADEHDAGRGS
jgi:hypothetical protein